MCESVTASIASQEIHRRKMTFEEEFRTLLQKHGMPFNERSVGTDQAEPSALSGDLWETLSPGLKPRAQSSCPFGVENPLRNLKFKIRLGRSLVYQFNRARLCALINAALVRETLSMSIE